MLDIDKEAENRRIQLRKWIDAYYKNQAEFVDKHDLNQGEISLLLKNKSFGSRKARKLETQTGMPYKYLDTDETPLTDTETELQLSQEQMADADRLRELFQKRSKVSQLDFGRLYDIGTQGMVSQYLTGRRPLNIEAATKFASGLDIKIDDFSPELAKKIQLASAYSGSIKNDIINKVQENMEKGEYVDSKIIPRFDTGGSMGSGLILRNQPGVIENIRVSSDWLQQNVKIMTSPSNLCVVTGFGDSMEPMFRSGDPLLIDRGVNVVDHDGVFFFRIENEGYVKRLQRIPSKDGLIIRARSENPHYEAWDITKGMDFEVFGKVLKVWASRDF